MYRLEVNQTIHLITNTKFTVKQVTLFNKYRLKIEFQSTVPPLDKIIYTTSN